MSDTTTSGNRSEEKKEEKLKHQPPYNVILHNDDDHSFEYVIGMLLQASATHLRWAIRWPGKYIQRPGHCRDNR